MSNFMMTEGDLTFGFRTGTDILDNRKEKTYARKIAILGTCTQEVWKEASSPFENLLEKLKRAVKGLPGNTQSYTPEFYIAGGWGVHQVSVRFDILANKPSKILDETKAWERFGASPADVAQKIVEAFVLAHKDWKEEQALAERQRDAVHIRSWATTILRESAKNVVRYEQRLAGLKAELQAEIAVQFALQREALEKRLLEIDSHKEFDPRSVRAGLQAAAVEALREPGPFDMASTPIDKKEVT